MSLRDELSQVSFEDMERAILGCIGKPPESEASFEVLASRYPGLVNASSILKVVVSPEVGEATAETMSVGLMMGALALINLAEANQLRSSLPDAPFG